MASFLASDDCGAPRTLVMYGSQTGIAQSIAQRIFDYLSSHNVPSEIIEANRYKKSSCPTGNGFFGEKRVIIVCSTTGNADCPDNCERFWRYLKRRSLDSDLLSGMEYAVLGLGDTNYDNFCYMGKAIDKRMAELGARRLVDVGCADDAVGLETVVEPWVANLWKTLSISGGNLSSTVPTAAAIKAVGGFSVVPPSELMPKQPVSKKDNRVLVMYGSQTGIAQSIAQRIFDYLSSHNVPSEIIEANRYKKSSCPTGNGFFGEKRVIIVCSTTGNADCPDNCERFWRYLKRRSLDSDLLSGMKYAVLGLGDTNYDNFCYMGKAIDKRMAELGARRLVDVGCADDAVGLETVVEPWVANLWKTLSISGGNLSSTVPTAAAIKAVGGFSVVPPSELMPKQPVSKKDNRVLVMYGSQTGIAQSIAQRIFDYLSSHNVPSEIIEANRYKKSSCPTGNGFFGEKRVIIVCSTTGNADCPDNCERFWRYLKRRSLDSDLLSGMKYAVLGLGDTNYDNFCYMGKAIDKRMAELGARRLVDVGCADDAVGLETVVEPWIAKLWQVVGVNEPVQLSPSGSKSFKQASSDQVLCVEGEAKGSENIIPRVPSLGNLALVGQDTGKATVDTPASPESRSRYSSSNPCTGTVIGAKYLTSGGSAASRRVIHLDISIPSRDDGCPALDYTPGDAIGIVCQNRPSEVNFVLEHLGLQHVADAHFEIKVPECTDNGARSKKFERQMGKILSIPRRNRTPRRVLTHHLDFGGPLRKITVKKLAAFCSELAEKARMEFLASRDGKRHFEKDIVSGRVGLPQLLKMFPSCKPSLDVLVIKLPSLVPRFYSVASSPLDEPEVVSVAFTVVEYEVSGERRQGLCTSWLEKMCQPLLDSKGSNVFAALQCGTSIDFFIREAKEFVLPANLNWPLIFVGPGTGIAPFIGFISHRAALARLSETEKDDICSGFWRGGFELDHFCEDDESPQDRSSSNHQGSIHLFFGCRNRNEDFLYKDKLQDFLSANALTSLHTAFSREQEEKVYVQNRLSENAELVADALLNKNGYFYICGDGAKMANDVEKTLIDILKTVGKLNGDETAAVLTEMKDRGRYVKDVWS